jgi:hypothetical protein
VPTLESAPFNGFFLMADENNILDFLNKYGAEAFYTEYKKPGGSKYPGAIEEYRDLTNDGLPEIVFVSGPFYIFGCKEGHYVTLYKAEFDAIRLWSPEIIKILDANRNGLPEITLLFGYASQGGHTYGVIEWGGDQFQYILITADRGPYLFVEVSGDLKYGDVDQDGVIEYIANIGIPTGETYSLGIPWRNETQIYKWNGKQFIYNKSIFSTPEYRFQAVQDGDRAMNEGDLDKALTFYQMAISNDQLQWWSPERRNFVLTVFRGRIGNLPTPIPPLPDPKEYSNLAAYSYYRIMLDHLVRGRAADAKVAYDTLQNTYTDGKPGHIYAALAEIVRTEFLQTNDSGKACNKAQQFVLQNNEEVVYYISGSGFPGNHGIDYKKNPELICPFK